MGWRTHQLNRAFSAYEFFDDSNLGRCPRLQLNRAFGAKHVPLVKGEVTESPRNKKLHLQHLQDGLLRMRLGQTAGKIFFLTSVSLLLSDAGSQFHLIGIIRARSAPR